MIILFFISLLCVGCNAMQPTTAFGLSNEAKSPHSAHVSYTQEIAAIRVNLWQIKALTVRYQNSGITNHALSHHNSNIKSAYAQVIEACDKATAALSPFDLSTLAEQINLAKRLSFHLHKEANHFKMIIEKKVQHSKM